MGQAADTYLQHHPYAYTSFVMARSPIDYTILHGGTHVRIFSHTFFKNKYFKIFWAFSDGPRGPTPTFSNSSPRVTYPRIFSRLSTSILTKGFTQALPTSNVTPTPTPHSDPPQGVTYLGIFFRLSTSILTLAFTQALPPLTSSLHQCHIPIPLLAIRTLRSSSASLPRF